MDVNVATTPSTASAPFAVEVQGSVAHGWESRGVLAAPPGFERYIPRNRGFDFFDDSHRYFLLADAALSRLNLVSSSRLDLEVMSTVVATYMRRSDFSRDLRERLDLYFATTGQPRRDVPRAYV